MSRSQAHAFHHRRLKRVLGSFWHISNRDILRRAKVGSMFEKWLRWLGHVRHFSDGRLPTGILYRELADGTRAMEDLFSDRKTYASVTLKYVAYKKLAGKLCLLLSARKKAVGDGVLKSELEREKNRQRIRQGGKFE